MQRIIINIFKAAYDIYHTQKPASSPGTSVFLALHGNEVVSVTTESVKLDLQMRQNIPCFFSPLPGCMALP